MVFTNSLKVVGFYVGFFFVGFGVVFFLALAPTEQHYAAVIPLSVLQ